MATVRTGAAAVGAKSVAGKGASSVRIDVWLWRARFFKTRSLAAKAVSAGSIRIDRNGAPARLDKPSALLRPGDVLSVVKADGHVRIVEVSACGERRGPAPEAMTLYIDRTPAIEPEDGGAPLAARKGRPTKKDRRALDAFRGDGDA